MQTAHKSYRIQPGTGASNHCFFFFIAAAVVVVVEWNKRQIKSAFGEWIVYARLEIFVAY